MLAFFLHITILYTNKFCHGMFKAMVGLKSSNSPERFIATKSNLHDNLLQTIKPMAPTSNAMTPHMMTFFCIIRRDITDKTSRAFPILESTVPSVSLEWSIDSRCLCKSERTDTPSSCKRGIKQGGNSNILKYSPPLSHFLNNRIRFGYGAI
jgi:hypothetical protein